MFAVACGSAGETTHPGHGYRAGRALVNGVLTPCPVIADVLVTPPSPAVGETATIAASASDASDAPLTYRWSASSGVLRDARTAVAKLRATLPGTIKLDVIVSNGSCNDRWTVAMTVVESAESSDGNP